MLNFDFEFSDNFRDCGVIRFDTDDILPLYDNHY